MTSQRENTVDSARHREYMEDSGMENSGNSCLIVGIGASAGGLEALQHFFSTMSSSSDLAFVVVQHLSPDYKSLLAEILSKQTRMPVVQAENEMEVLPNRVYLIPPKNNMILQRGRLHLKEYVHGGINHPIDIFFCSLAEEMRDQNFPPNCAKRRTPQRKKPAPRRRHLLPVSGNLSPALRGCQRLQQYSAHFRRFWRLSAPE